MGIRKVSKTKSYRVDSRIRVDGIAMNVERSGGLLHSLIQKLSQPHSCIVCNENFDSARKPGWYRRSIDRFGSLAKKAYGKGGSKGVKKLDAGYAIVLFNGRPESVPVCSDGCRRLATLVYEEDKECLDKDLMDVQSLKLQLDALREFLRSGNLAALTSLARESEQLATSLD